MKERKSKFSRDFGPAARNMDESFEPSELQNPVPWPLIAIALALAIAGGVTLYLDAKATPRGEDAQQERTAADEGAAPVDASVAEMDDAEGDFAVAQGAALFGTYCATCHQTNGSGVRGAIPPLDGSRYVLADAQVPAAILLRGIAGPIEVKGELYNGRMPTFHATLEDEEIALILTHIRAKWSNTAEMVSPDQVAGVRQALDGDLDRPWESGSELEDAFGIEAAPAADDEGEPAVSGQDADAQEDPQ